MNVAGMSVAKPGPPAVSAITRSKLLIARCDSTISVEKNTGRRLGMMMRQ